LLLDGLHPVHVLPFWSSYWGEEGKEGGDIRCVCISERVETSEVFVSDTRKSMCWDTTAKDNLVQVAAAAGECVVIWSTSNIVSGNEKWQVHSRIQVGEGNIASIDMRQGMYQ
jgi:hypothetical protein